MMRFECLLLMMLFTIFMVPPTLAFLNSESSCPDAVVLLEPNRTYSHSGTLAVFRFPGLLPSPMWVWSKVFLSISCDSLSFDLFLATDNLTLCDSYLRSRSLWSLLHSRDKWSSARENVVSVAPFKETYIAVAPSVSSRCTAMFNVQKVSAQFSILLGVSLLLFLKATSLSSNVVLHYSAGTFVGVFGSILVLSFFLCRCFPERNRLMPVAVMFGGWSLTMFMGQWVYTNALEIARNNLPILIGYIVVVGSISLAFCYYRGPIANPRAQTIINLTLKVIALVGVYCSFQLEEMSLAAILIICLHGYVLKFFNVYDWLKMQWYTRFPEKKRLLTENEYRAQAERETEIALRQLREFCQSSECNAWRVINKVSHPSRFASFVEGDSHVSDMETSRYDAEMSRLEFESSDEEERPSTSAAAAAQPIRHRSDFQPITNEAEDEEEDCERDSSLSHED